MADISRDDQRIRARRQWAALRATAATVTPQAIARFAIAAAVVLVCAAIVAGTWPTLLPFVFGAVLAYSVLPIANRLDRFMPRVLAAVIAELVAVAVLVFAAVAVFPSLISGFGRVATSLPSSAEVQAALASFQAQLGDLPEPVRTIVLTVATDVAANLQSAVRGLADGAADFITGQILGIFETASFVFGLLVIPVWVLTIVKEREIKRTLASSFSPGLRPDAFAVLRIVDRGLSTFIRVQVVQAIVTAVFIWLGLTITNGLELTSVTYAVSAAALLGVMQLVPQLGYLLGFLPLLLILPISGPVAFATALVVYIVANRAAGSIVSTGVSRGVLDVHPALMIPGIVVIGQLGVIPLLAAAPIIAISRDLVRYVHGRLSEPPQPAGVLPGARRRRSTAAAAVVAPVPSVYRDARQSDALPTLAPTPARRPLPTAAMAVAAGTATVVTAGIAAAQHVTEWRPNP
jgi:predicted PurR-regulated permease PerM